MELEYNGVKMELVDFVKRERSLVYDDSGTDVLYVRHVIGATCMIARGGWPVSTEVLDDTLPGAVLSEGEAIVVSSTNLIPVPPPLPDIDLRENIAFWEDNGNDGSVGAHPVLSDIDIRVRLYQPRRQLSISAFGDNGEPVYWLYSPSPGFSVDVCNGPKVRAVDLIEENEEANSIGVYFEVETCLPPCLAGFDQAVLSHRWTMSHQHDENFYLTRIIQGTVVFNGAVLRAQGLNADWFRQQFFHPIPLGYQRQIPQVALSNDGLTLSYVVTDTDTSVTFDPADTGATQIEIVEKLGYSSGIKNMNRALNNLNDRFKNAIEPPGGWIDRNLRRPFGIPDGGFK